MIKCKCRDCSHQGTIGCPLADAEEKVIQLKKRRLDVDEIIRRLNEIDWTNCLVQEIAQALSDAFEAGKLTEVGE